MGILDFYAHRAVLEANEAYERMDTVRLGFEKLQNDWEFKDANQYAMHSVEGRHMMPTGGIDRSATPMWKTR